MMQKSVKRWITFFLIPFLLDRLTKYLIVSEIVPNQDVTSFLEVYLTYNRGISWGIGGSSDLQQFMLVSLLVALVIVGFGWYIRVNKMSQWAYGACLMIMSGAISNFIDRFWYGGVVDFIRFYWGTYSFPVFNIADVFISMGTLFFVYFHWCDDN